MQIGDDEVITVAQAAERLGVSPATLRQQIKKDVLKAVRAGGVYLLRASEVERYRRDHLGKPGPKRKES